RTRGSIGRADTPALKAGHTFYTYSAALPELRATIADYLTRRFERGDRPSRPHWPMQASVVPAKAGTHRSAPGTAEAWVPAFAGTTTFWPAGCDRGTWKRPNGPGRPSTPADRPGTGRARRPARRWRDRRP